MACHFTKVSEEKIEEAFFHPSLRVGEGRWIYIHHYSPSLRGIVVYYCYFLPILAIVLSYFSVIQ